MRLLPVCLAAVASWACPARPLPAGRRYGSAGRKAPEGSRRGWWSRRGWVSAPRARRTRAGSRGPLGCWRRGQVLPDLYRRCIRAECELRVRTRDEGDRVGAYTDDEIRHVLDQLCAHRPCEDVPDGRQALGPAHRAPTEVSSTTISCRNATWSSPRRRSPMPASTATTPRVAPCASTRTSISGSSSRTSISRCEIARWQHAYDRH